MAEFEPFTFAGRVLAYPIYAECPCGCGATEVVGEEIFGYRGDRLARVEVAA